MPQWTQQQNNAITARGRNILVSAAAGSGKTAVLVERVIKMITDKDNPVELDRLLIVTFTNAAAAEMKYRISKSLNDLLKQSPNDSFILKQISLLPNAMICTIDSFCTNLVRENFFELSISQDFTILEENDLDLIQETVIDELINEYFEKGDSRFISLVESFTTPNSDRDLITSIKKTLRFIYAQPFPYVWLDSAVEKYNPDIPFSKTQWYSYIADEIRKLIDLALTLVNENLELADFGDYDINDKFQSVLKQDYAQIISVKNAFEKSWDNLVNANISFERFPSSKKADPVIVNKIKVNRNIYKNILTDEIQSFLVTDSKSYKSDMQKLYSQLLVFAEMVKEVDKRVFEEKKERNAYSFSDIENFAIRLLFKLNENQEVEKTEIAGQLSKQYYEILVDEYQDTNEAQDMLFTNLSNGRNLFTVGDIKQSIYRFRLAMPHIFNNRKKEYAPYNADDNAVSSKIILDKNFRSRKDICSYVNFIFSNIMSENVGEIDYNEEEYLNYGANYEKTSIPSAQIRILNGAKGEDKDEAEATCIARTIKEKIASKELIKDGDTYRPIRYGDIAILMSSLKNHIDTYSKVLADYGIPVICDNATNLFDNKEIKIIVSYLRCIDNPTLDIPLLATMMSPIYGFTADELSQIKLESKAHRLYDSVSNSKSEKVKAFLDDLADLRKIAITMSVSSFIRFLVESKGIVAFTNAMGNGEQRYQNILMLISFAQNFDNGVNVGLTSFLRYLDKIIDSDKSVSSSAVNPSGEDAVTIMSVHHSKGLEFPVCILAGSSRRYNKTDLSSKLLLNSEFGLGIKCHNEEGMYQFESLAYAVLKHKNTTEFMSEKMRVLYVAVTRAKEQFIAFITCDDIMKKAVKLSGDITSFGISPSFCRKAMCDADFLLICSLLHKDGSVFGINSFEKISKYKSSFPLDIKIFDGDDDEHFQNEIKFADPDEDIIKQIESKLSFSYKRSTLSAFSSKLTASSLDDEDYNFEYLTSTKPAFLNKGGLTPAQRGTAMHTFMQFCDYKNAKENLEDEISKLLEKGFLNKEQCDSLDRKKLTDFFTSSFANRIFTSNNIYRELKVSTFVKASEIYDTDFEDAVLIQGIADCVFEENDQLILVDYKTDRVNTPEELLDRYKNQIAFYKTAVSRVLNKPVSESVLYSFHLGKICSYK
ncbi:MAG: helicase-exonuclease AddAB subunit AddA [Clostridiales bacterium]|nr:helicase-exonuclease AddAB subunit AddA [Clostridiales bacterium]